jgi:hypothetical protein
MKSIRLIALCALMLSASLAIAQEHEGGMPPMGAPEEMKSVDFLLGEWTVDLAYRMSPEAEWVESKGSAHVETELEGCVQTMHYEGEIMGMGFTGKDTLTYNRERSRFESFWIDSMSAHASTAQGNWEGDLLIMTGKDMQMGQEYYQRTTTKKVSDDEVSFIMEMSMDGENFFESMRMDYRRKG